VVVHVSRSPCIKILCAFSHACRWEFVIWVLWLVLCCFNIFPGIEKTLYKMHVGILRICKYWGISSNTATKHYTTTPPRIIVGLKIESYSRTHPLVVAYRQASMLLHPDYNSPNLTGPMVLLRSLVAHRMQNKLPLLATSSRNAVYVMRSISCINQ